MNLLKNSRLKWLLCLTLTVNFCLLVHGAHADEDSTLRILFTNNSNGKLVFCNCPNDPYGGLAERVPLVREYREYYDNVLLLSSGGYMGLTGVEMHGPLVFKLMEVMDYDCFGIGDQELFSGLGKFMERFGDQRENIVSASIMDENGKRVFEPFRIVEVNGHKVGILGLTCPGAFKFFPKARMDFGVEDPDVTLAEFLPELRASCDYLVVLSLMGREKDEEIAKKWDGIDLIIGGHSQTLLEKEINISGCRIVQAGKGGGRVGEVVVQFGEAKNVTDVDYKLFEVNDRYKVLPEIEKILGEDVVR